MVLLCLAMSACSGNDDDLAIDDDSIAAQAVLTHDNYLQITDYVLGLYTSNAYDMALFAGSDYFAGNEAISVETLDQQAGVTRRIYGCQNGGSATITSWSFGAGADRTLEQEYDNCQWNGIVQDGNVDYTLEPYSRHSWHFTGFSIIDVDENAIRAEGNVDRSYSLAKHDNFNSWSTAIKRLESEADDGVTLLTDMETFFGYGNEGLTPATYLNGDFTVSSPKTGGQTLMVTTPVAFVNAGSELRVFPLGRLEIRASDDNVIALDTDDGDGSEETVAVQLTIDGETETYSVPWSTWSTTLTFAEDGPG